MKQEKIELHFEKYQERKSRIISDNGKIKGIGWRKAIRPLEWPGYDMKGQIDNGCFPKEKREWIRVQQTMAKLNPNWWNCCWITRDI